ncbi:DUF3419 family protein [Pelagicoccus enzymogenes]|uniref:DUF3419 family protein n=1 Tax=Pelagicoccus enzymogenes TaxID=2773457 RepID=UPI00280C92A2|nr:DUF3419 family protein [Pelagicoccus enzymogenes]MDQ8200863.1 DUF3419 family protein [Pelagicoccus enzymogenes]
MKEAPTEAASRADFSKVRYAQVWEDADILTEALNIGPDSVCLSIASAGDNALALLTRNPKRVYAIDLNPAQLHCLALRVAAFRSLSHQELLELIGTRPSQQRLSLYERCRENLQKESQEYWDALPETVASGIGTQGKFERYFELFRKRVVPLVHSQKTVDALFVPRIQIQRLEFYESRWNNWRWRALFKIFFSRFTMGRLGRDPAFFKYVEGSVADRILERVVYALTELNPEDNPYLQWILKGRFESALPLYLRPEHFETIRSNLDRLEWQLASVEDFTRRAGEPFLDACNLSDIFEYMSETNTEKLLRELYRVSRPGARLAYWNMLAPRSRPQSMAAELTPLNELAESLFKKDKAFFYSKFIVEEVASP